MDMLLPPPAAAGLFLGSFWLVVVLVLGVVAIAVIRSRFDP
jgi:hypothetical protein